MDLPDQQEQRVTEDRRYLHDKSKTTESTQESLKIDCSLYTVSNFLFLNTMFDSLISVTLLVVFNLLHSDSNMSTIIVVLFCTMLFLSVVEMKCYNLSESSCAVMYCSTCIALKLV